MDIEEVKVYTNLIDNNIEVINKRELKQQNSNINEDTLNVQIIDTKPILNITYNTSNEKITIINEKSKYEFKKDEIGIEIPDNTKIKINKTNLKTSLSNIVPNLDKSKINNIKYNQLR